MYNHISCVLSYIWKIHWFGGEKFVGSVWWSSML